MLKKHLKKAAIVTGILILSTLGISKIWASEKQILNVPKGKSVLLDSENLKTNAFKWKSENENVVEIDRNVDCAFAKNIGNTDVVLKDNEGKILSEYEIIVTEPEKLRITYASNLSPKVNSTIKLFAITDLNVEYIRFVLEKNTGGQIYLTPKDKKIDEDTLVWSTDILIEPNTQDNIKCEYLHNGTWHKTDKIIKLLKSDVNNNDGYSLSYRLPSLDCVKFIANYEGFLKKLRKDPLSGKNVYDIGYGNLVKPNKPFYNDITSTYAIALMYNVMCNKKYTKDLNEFLIENKIKFNQQQFDALVSFCYNLGTRWIKNSDLKNILLDCENKPSKILGKVNYKSGIRLRKMPNLSGNILTAIPFGEEVEVLSNQKFNGDWYNVKTKNGLEGFCFSEGMDIINKKQEKIEKTEFITKTEATVVYKSGIRVRKDPSLSGKILTAIPYGEKIEVLDLQKQNNNWYKIKTKSGLVGYCFDEGLNLEQKVLSNKNNEVGRSLKNIDREKFSNEVLLHCHANKKILRGLLYRRIDELEMFLFNDYEKDGRLNKCGIEFPERLKLELTNIG